MKIKFDPKYYRLKIAPLGVSVSEDFGAKMEQACKRLELELECHAFGLTSRHAAQRFRRWKERQK